MKEQNKDNIFEEQLKAALENHRADYDPSDWEDMEKRLDDHDRRKKAFFTRSLWSILFLALLSGSGYLLTNPNIFLTSEKMDTGNNPTFANIIPNVTENESAFPETAETKGSMKESNKDNSIILAKAGNNEQEKEKIASEKMAVSVTNQIPVENEADLYSKKELVTSNAVIDGNTTYPAPKAKFSIDSRLTCVNSTVQFQAEENLIPVEYKWDFGDGSTSEKPNPRHVYRQQGVYQVMLSVTSLLDGTSSTYTLPRGIIIHPSPIADFDWKGPGRKMSDPEYTFINKSLDGSSYYWNFGDKEKSGEENPEHLYQKKGYYTVTFAAVNSYGCSDTARKEIYVEEDYNLLAPNAFSPDGDGVNDSWLPLALEEEDIEFSLSVIDVSTNTVVFSTSDKHIPWDGRLKGTSSKAMPGEIYAWIAQVKFPDGDVKAYGGTITIANQGR